MQEPATERGPRGKYSSLICHGCRSRKIKCILPSPEDLAPLGVPQPQDKACNRCQNFGLECIVERTFLGRPAAKRGIRKAPPRDLLSTSTPSAIKESRDISPLLDTEIKSHLFGDIAYGTSIFDKDTQLKELTLPNKKAIFRSMVDPLYFFSSILANDQSFGINIPQLSTRWNASLPDLISSDLAHALDKFLSWHRFFLPKVPTIASLRARLESEDDDISATALLFSLLCLTALETTQDVSRNQPHLKLDLQLAISHYGQEFLFSPPVHPDSIAAALFLAEYQPTAVATSQRVVHRTVKSEAYISLAHRIAERLEILPTQCSLDLAFQAEKDEELEDRFFSFLQGLQVYCSYASLGGFITTPSRVARGMVDCLKPHIEDCQRLLSQRHCSPTMIYHIQSIIGTYIHMKAAIDLKENWSSSENLFMILDQFEKDYLEQIKISSGFLGDALSYAEQDEVSAASSILEMQFQSIFVTVCGFALIYATSKRERAQSGSTRDDPELNHDEAIQIGSQVIQWLTNATEGMDLHHFTLMQQFGVPYPSYVQKAIAMFIENTRKLKLGGMPFRPPPRLLVAEVVRQCKNLIENNVILIKCYGRLHFEFEDQFRMFEESARLLEKMRLSPWNSVDAAFADGCLYAASGRVIRGFMRLMNSFRSLTIDGLWVTKQGHSLELPLDFDISRELGSDFLSPEWQWLWPSIGESNGDTLQESGWVPEMFTLGGEKS